MFSSSSKVTAILEHNATKHRPKGRRVDLSPAMVSLVKKILKNVNNDRQPILPQSQQYVKDLQHLLRRLITVDPSKLPLVTLYSTRHYFCTNMYKLGCSSAWIMAQMAHKGWETTCLYIHIDGKPSWRDVFTGDKNNDNIPYSAITAPLLQEPSKTKACVTRRIKALREVDEIDDWEQAIQDDFCT